MSLNNRNESNNFTLATRTPNAVEKAKPGAKRILSGMVADALALAAVAEGAKAHLGLGFTGKQPLGLCPNCGGKVFEAAAGYLCERSQVEPQACGFRIGKIVLQQPVDADQVRQLLATGTTDLLDRFVSKAGQTFSAYLVIDAGKITFAFPQTTQRLSRCFELKWRLGARTGDLVAKVASQFASRITVSSGEKVIDAKDQWAFAGLNKFDFSKMSSCLDDHSISPDQRDLSPFDLGCGDSVELLAEGPDAAAAMESLAELFGCGSRVEQCKNPGCSSKPCLVAYSKQNISYSCYKGHTWNVPKSDNS